MKRNLSETCITVRTINQKLKEWNFLSIEAISKKLKKPNMWDTLIRSSDEGQEPGRPPVVGHVVAIVLESMHQRGNTVAGDDEGKEACARFSV